MAVCVNAHRVAIFSANCVRDQTGFELIGTNFIMKYCFGSGADVVKKEVFNVEVSDVCVNSTICATTQQKVFGF
jgi:hypothetical protein